MDRRSLRIPTVLALAALVVSTSASEPARGQDDPWANHPPQLDSDRTDVYKTVDDHELRLWSYLPKASTGPSEGRPAIVFFFGGGWRRGSPLQFEPHARHLASRGMVAILADYRVKDRHGTNANRSVADARSAIRWVRSHAGELGVDTQRIAAGGGSAGGHLAAATLLLSEHDESTDDQSIDARPNALALFNPALVLAPVEGVDNGRTPEALAQLEARSGASLESVSPYHGLSEKAHLVPTIIFHGRADRVVAYETAELFCTRMSDLGGDCELVGYEGKGHGFFNHRRADGVDYDDTLARTDAFFVSLGWLDP